VVHNYKISVNYFNDLLAQWSFSGRLVPLIE